MENESEAGKSIGAVAIDPQRLLDEHQRRVQAAALIVNLPETMQRVEIAGLMPHDGVVKALGGGEVAASQARCARRTMRERFDCKPSPAGRWLTTGKQTW